MARVVPPDIGRLELAGASRHEIETLKTLQSRLSDDYTVFHGVHWSREYAGDSVFGEIDFVVVSPAGRALLIEQKNAALEETAEGLVAHYADGPKNVARQVHRALDHVRDKFRRAQHGRAAIELDYLIYCPAHRLAGVNAAGLDRSRIVDASQREALAGRIEVVLGSGAAGATGGEAWAETVCAFFRQTLDLVPDIHAHVTSQERAFTRLGGELVRLLRGLEMTPLRLRVRGTAGSGKSLIAREFVATALGAGRRPLLVCFNRPLAERLRAHVPAGGRVSTFMGLCSDFLLERGHSIDFGTMRTNPGFWDEVAERVTGEPIPGAWRFDTLVVDEGQDFEPEWVEILRLFLREPHDVLWLEDPDQHVRGPGPVRLEGFVGFRARTNYRSPQAIARFVQRTLPFEFEAASTLPGLGVGVTPYRDPADQPAIVARLVADLLRQGFEPGQIVVLTTRHVATPGTPRSALDGRDRVGNYRLRRFTGTYDLLGNQLTTRGQITFDSIGRFKGQEAPAVILVDVDPDPGDADREDRLLYAGMTRATVRLDLVVREDNPLNGRFPR